MADSGVFQENYDVAIIGGGINGAGIARDLSQRGLSVLLVEKNDFGSGTTAASTRLIHGGLRYLEHFDFALVRESLHERKILLQIAPHLVFPLEFILPVYAGQEYGRAKLKAGMLLYDILSLGKSLPKHRMLSRRRILRLQQGMNPQGLHGGFAYFDCQVPLPERLTLENIRAARQAGALCLNYHRLAGLEVAGDGCWQVRFEDVDTGEQHQAAAGIVINAAGPWVNDIAGLADPRRPRLVGGTRGSHILVANTLGLRHALYSPARSDGRPFFIIPFGRDELLIGTTDIFYDASVDEVRADSLEVRYLISETNHLLPELNIRPEMIRMTYSGVRPLPPAEGKDAGAVTRRHFIKQHETGDDRRAFLSIIGGKLTTYRQLAEEVGDKVADLLSAHLPGSRTAREPLPGTPEQRPWQRRPVRRRTFPELNSDPLLLYGKARRHILEIAGVDSVEKMSPDEILVAEARYCARHEQVRHLDDFLLRRSMWGLRRGKEGDYASAAAQAMARELAWTDSRMLLEIARYNRILARAFSWQEDTER